MLRVEMDILKALCYEDKMLLNIIYRFVTSYYFEN